MIIGYLFIGILHGKMDEAYDRTISKTIQVVSSRYSLRVRVDTPWVKVKVKLLTCHNEPSYKKSQFVTKFVSF